MPEAVSLGTVYSTAELRLDGFNKSWSAAIGKIKELQEKLDGLKFDPAKLVAGADGAGKSFAGLTKNIARAETALAKLSKAEFKATGILRGADQATRALGELAERAGLTSQRVLDLSAKFTEAKAALRSLGTAAGGAEKTVGALGTTSGATAAAVGDVGKAGLDSGAGLETLADGATAAKTSVSALGRAAGLTVPKLDALSLTKFDPAGVVAGADEGIGALTRLRLAAQGVRNSLRMSPAMTGVSGANGRRRGGAGAALASGGGMLASGAANVAAGATVIAGIDLKNYVEYSGQAQQVAGNTNMAPADQQRMYQSGLRAMRLGADGEKAMRSYMHIANHDFSGQEADTIQDYAVKINVGTGADMEKSGQVLSAFLHQAKMKATPANVSRAANLQHQATASGDLDMELYNKYGAPAVGKAYSLGNSPVDSLAFLTAMTKQNMRIPQAATNLGGLSWQITHPTAKAQKAIDKAGLQNYFGPEALHTYGAYGILQHTNETLGGNKAKLMDIFANKQGGFAALLATGPGRKDYGNQLNNPKNGNRAAWEGKIKPVEERYNQMQKTPQQQVKRLQGEMKADSIEIGKSFVPLLTAAVPVLKMFAGQVQRVVGFLGKLPLPVQEAIVGLGVMKLATVALGNPLLGLGEGVGGLITKLAGLGEGATVLEGLGALAGPIALVAAGVALLAVAWATDFGHIREVTAKVGAEVKSFVNSQFGYVVRWFRANMPLIRETVRTVLAAIQQFWHDHGQRILAILGPMWAIIKTVFSAALHILGAVVKLAMDVITGHWGAAAKDVGVIVTNLWAVVRSLFQNGAKMIGNALMLIVSLIFDMEKRFTDAALHLGGSIVSGIVQGIKSHVGDVGLAVTGLGGVAIDAIKNKLAIHSPSRVMHEVGRNTAQGLAEGITAGKSQVTAAMRGVVEAALKEANPKKASFLIDHEARSLRAGGMSASDVADFRESAHAQLSGTGRSGRSAKAAAAQEKRAEREREQQTKANGRAEEMAAKTTALLAQTRERMAAKLAELTDTPQELTADKKRDAAWNEFQRNGQALGFGQFGPYSQSQLAGKDQAAALLGKTLGKIQSDQDAKTQAATGGVQDDIDRQNDKAAQDKHPYGFQRDKAHQELDPAGTAVKAGADPAKVAEDLRLRLAAIDKEEAEDGKQAEDRKQQYLLATQGVTLSEYQDYLKTRLGDYKEYSAEWVQISGSLNDIDLQLWKQQEDALKQKFDSGLLDLKDYITQMRALEATLPKTASPDEKAGIDDRLAHLDGKEKRASDKEAIGGEGFWKDLTDSAAEGGSHFLTALLHPKDRKSLFKSMQTDLMGSLESGLTKGLASLLKNMISGGLGGMNLSSFFGGLFGAGHKGYIPGNPYSTVAAGGDPGMSAGGGSSPVGLLGMLGKGGLGGIAKFLPWLGGGLMLNSVLGNPLGKVFKGIKKLFHFARGTWSVPGSGSGDTVPAMLTPGEMVLPKAGAQVVREALGERGDHSSERHSLAMRGGGIQIHVTHNGDVNNHEDGERFHRDVAMQIKQQLPVTTPGT